jgi:hypothetical protein
MFRSDIHNGYNNGCAYCVVGGWEGRCGGESCYQLSFVLIELCHHHVNGRTHFCEGG